MVADTVPCKTDLHALAVTVRVEIAAMHENYCNALQRALSAGDALIAAQDALSERRQWINWLRTCCSLKERTAFLYMRLARRREVIEAEQQHVGDLSLRAALRLIADKGAAPKKSAKPKPALSPLMWATATPDQRTLFLNAIGLPAILAAMPPPWHAEIRQRVLGQERASARADNKSDSLIVKALRQALSLQKAAKGNELAAGVAAALNTMNNLLLKDGADLNDIVGIELGHAIRTTKRRAA
jgi:hypothetical protein